VNKEDKKAIIKPFRLVKTRQNCHRHDNYQRKTTKL